jgi:HK97 family phage major capsid protein
MPALAATNKAALYGNFNYYAVAEREGLVVMRNPYLYQATGQVGLFARARFGGAVLQAEAFYYMTQHA